MEIVENNYIEQKANGSTKDEVYEVECEYCNSKLKITKKDVNYGWLGEPYITCPCCKKNCDIDFLPGIEITASNITYPIHFLKVNKDQRNVVHIEDSKINKSIQDGIEYFRANKDEYVWYTQYGDSHINMYRYDGDEEYYVVVTQDYFEACIEFEKEDY